MTITGGSVNANPAHVDPAPSNGTARVSRVLVDGLTPDAVVAFDGLPDYYGTTGIYADADGKAYLWLPEDWTTPVTPKLLAAAPKSKTSGFGLKAAGTGTAHTFAANGYSYAVEISSDGGEATAEKGEALQLDRLVIRDFAIEDGWLYIGVTANPATWLYGFADRLMVRSSESLPIPASGESLLDLSRAELLLEDGENATIAVPLPDGSSSMFFRVESE